MWFITYRNPLRPGEGGIKLVLGKDATLVAGQHLEASGYVITKVAPTSKARMDALLAGTVSDPKQSPLG
jgi:hypothetical protein